MDLRIQLFDCRPDVLEALDRLGVSAFAVRESPEVGWDLLVADLRTRDPGAIRLAAEAAGGVPLVVVCDAGQALRARRANPTEICLAPVDPARLADRLALAAHVESPERVPLAAGALDLGLAAVVRDGEALSLTPIEVSLLALMVAEPGRAFRKEELLSRVWGHAPGVKSRAVAHTVSRLRKKLEVDPAAPDHLQTAFGVGYAWVPLAAPPALVGRDAELNAVVRGVAAERVQVVVGAVGSGVSALLRSVRDALVREGRKVVSAELTSRSTEAQLRTLGEAAGVRLAGLRAPLAGLVAGLAGAVVVLDAPEGVEPSWVDALARGGVQVVVGTHQQLGEDWTQYTLGPLSVGAARELLRQRRPELSADQVAALVERCERLPLTLLRLAADPTSDPEDAMASVHSVVARRWEGMSAPAREAVVALSLVRELSMDEVASFAPAAVVEEVLAGGWALSEPGVDGVTRVRVPVFARRFASDQPEPAGVRAQVHAWLASMASEMIAVALSPDDQRARRWLGAHRDDLLAAHAAAPDLPGVLEAHCLWSGLWGTVDEGRIAAERLLASSPSPQRCRVAVWLARQVMGVGALALAEQLLDYAQQDLTAPDASLEHALGRHQLRRWEGAAEADWAALRDLVETERGRVLLDIVDARQHIGRPGNVELAASAVERARVHLGSCEQLPALYGYLTVVEDPSGELSVPVAREALAVARAWGAPHQEVRALAYCAVIRSRAGLAAEGHLEAAHSLARALQDQAMAVELDLLLAVRDAFNGAPEAAVTRIDRLLEAEHVPVPTALRGRTTQAIARLFLFQDAKAAGALAAIVAEAEALGFAPLIPLLKAYWGAALALLGEVDRAEVALDAAAEGVVDAEARELVDTARGFVFLAREGLARNQGDPEAARRARRKWTERAGRVASPHEQARQVARLLAHRAAEA